MKVHKGSWAACLFLLQKGGDKTDHAHLASMPLLNLHFRSRFPGPQPHLSAAASECLPVLKHPGLLSTSYSAVPPAFKTCLKFSLEIPWVILTSSRSYTLCTCGLVLTDCLGERENLAETLEPNSASSPRSQPWSLFLLHQVPKYARQRGRCWGPFREGGFLRVFGVVLQFQKSWYGRANPVMFRKLAYVYAMPA